MKKDVKTQTLTLDRLIVVFSALVAIAANGLKLSPMSLLFVLGAFTLVLIYNDSLNSEIDGD